MVQVLLGLAFRAGVWQRLVKVIEDQTRTVITRGRQTEPHDVDQELAAELRNLKLETLERAISMDDIEPFVQEFE